MSNTDQDMAVPPSGQFPGNLYPTLPVPGTDTDAEPTLPSQSRPRLVQSAPIRDNHCLTALEADSASQNPVIPRTQDAPTHPASTATAPPNNRIRAAPTGGLSDNPQPTKKSRSNILPYMVPFLMQCLLQCRIDGKFDNPKKASWGPVWGILADQISTRFSCNVLPKTVESKYKSERRRYKDFMAAAARSDIRFCTEKRVFECSDDTWAAFKAEHVSLQPLNWLRKTPIGNIETYKAVFFRETATCSSTRTVDPAEAELVDDAAEEEEEEEEVSTPLPEIPVTAANTAHVAAATITNASEPEEASITKALKDFETNFAAKAIEDHGIDAVTEVVIKLTTGRTYMA